MVEGAAGVERHGGGLCAYRVRSGIDRKDRGADLDCYKIDHVYRQRLRSLQSVDDLVENIVQQVEDAGIANNTYII